MLCTSGFVDDIVFSHNGPMARNVYSYAAMEHDKYNSQDLKQILLNYNYYRPAREGRRRSFTQSS